MCVLEVKFVRDETVMELFGVCKWNFKVFGKICLEDAC